MLLLKKGSANSCTESLLVPTQYFARRYGTLIPAGVRVSMSVRALALAAGVSKPAVLKAMRRLMRAGMIRRHYKDRTRRESGAYVLLLPARANVDLSPTGRGQDSSGKGLRAPLLAPTLRWSAPLIERVGNEVIRSTIRRLGKFAGAVIDFWSGPAARSRSWNWPTACK